VDGALVATRIDISTPPKGFHLWEVNWAFRIQNKARKFWDFRIILENLTNTSYRNYLNRLRFYADEMGRNIKLQVNYNF
jgi:iron complex outermembrane receptor protein